MKKIIFLGAMHDDPSGKGRLHYAMQNLTANHKTAPKFLAFEWAQATYTTLVSKRSELTAQLRSRIPGRGEVFYDCLSNTLAYEPDLLMEINPEPKTIWMLNSSQRDDAQISAKSLTDRAINVKITNYLNWLLPKIHNWVGLSDEEVLKAATCVYMEESSRLAKLTEPDDGLNHSIKAGRDSYMFNQLQISLDKFKEGEHLGIIIVGAGHLANVPGSLFNLCLGYGLTVERRWPHEQ